MTESAAQLPLFSYASLSSTMDEARRIAQAGFAGAGIVRADTQTEGRGRIAGRRWVDAPGQSLLMTIIFTEGSAAVQALPLKVGLGVARALEAAMAPRPDERPSFWLKWPNDVVAARRAAASAKTPRREGSEDSFGKLCGILCETVGGRALAGIGLNVKRAALSAPASTIPPMSLEEVQGELSQLWNDLDGAARMFSLAVLESLYDPQWKRAYEARLWGLGQRLRFRAGHPDRPEIIEGICEGIREDGSLMLRTGGSLRAFASGEISSR